MTPPPIQRKYRFFSPSSDSIFLPLFLHFTRADILTSLHPRKASAVVHVCVVSPGTSNSSIVLVASRFDICGGGGGGNDLNMSQSLNLFISTPSRASPAFSATSRPSLSFSAAGLRFPPAKVKQSSVRTASQLLVRASSGSSSDPEAASQQVLVSENGLGGGSSNAPYESENHGGVAVAVADGGTIEVDAVTEAELKENGFRSTRRTKLICTIGPATCGSEQLEALAVGGMNVARINMCHGTREWHQRVIERVRRLNEEKGYAVAIMMDTEGSEIHMGDLGGASSVKAEVSNVIHNKFID